MASIPQVEELADAYRRAMREGDQRLGSSTTNRKILQALVVASAADTSRWIKTRVPSGDQVARPLENLLPALQEGNWVGEGLEYAQGKIFKEAKALVLASVGAAAWPLWVGGTVGLIAGFFGLIQDAGIAVGTAVAPLLLGGGTILVVIARGLFMAAPAMASAGSAATESLWSGADSVGADAEAVFNANLAGPLAGVYGGPLPAGVTPVQKLRGAAKLLLLAGYGFVGVAALVFLAGMGNAFSAASSTSTCELIPSQPACIQEPFPTAPFPTFPP